MSTDITAYKTMYENKFIGKDLKDEIDGFTLSHRLNDYWETYDFFIDYSDEILEINYDDVYMYSKQTIEKMIKKNQELNLGEDVNIFLDSCQKANTNNIYMKIIK